MDTESNITCHEGRYSPAEVRNEHYNILATTLHPGGVLVLGVTESMKDTPVSFRMVCCEQLLLLCEAVSSGSAWFITGVII